MLLLRKQFASVKDSFYLLTARKPATTLEVCSDEVYRTSAIHFFWSEVLS